MNVRTALLGLSLATALSGCPTAHEPPVSCRSSRDCSAAGLVCDTAAERCVECLTDVDCLGADEVCEEQACVVLVPCTSSRECPGQVCDTTLGHCVDCVGDVDCPEGMVCEASRCETPPTACVSDRNCSALGFVCDVASGLCVECVRDADCAADRECAPERVCQPRRDAGGPADAGLDALETLDAGLDAAVPPDGGVSDAGMDVGVRDAGGSPDAPADARTDAPRPDGGTRPDFVVGALTTAGCAIVDHVAITGDDRGPIGLSSSRFFITGDVGTGSLAAGDLTDAMSIPGVRHDGMVTDLASEDVWVLMADDVNPISSSDTPGSLRQIRLLDPNTGIPTAVTRVLSEAIVLSFTSAVISGHGEILIGTGSPDMQWWHIDIATGFVTQLGSTVLPAHQACESWAWWGVAERVGGVRSVVYVESPTRIARLQIPPSGFSSSAPTAVADFTDLGDMCGLVVSPSRQRWYFHHEYRAQFGGDPGGETAGYCSAVVTR